MDHRIESGFNIIGAGGHTRSLIHLLQKLNWKPSAIFDRGFVSTGEIIMGLPLKGSIEQLPSDERVMISTGDLLAKRELFVRFHERMILENAVHPSAIICESATLGQANQIFAGVIMNALVSIGDNNIINTGAIIEHETKVGSHNHISIGVLLSGRVNIGSQCFFGAGVVVNDGVTICDQVIIGSNSTVLHSITTPGTYVGNPIKKIK